MPSAFDTLSRRDFLKLAGYGFLGAALPGHPRPRFPQSYYTGLQGRVIDKSLWMYEEPSEEAGQVEMFWRDLIVPPTGAAISEDEEAYNRVWYEVDGRGYVYSGSVQPVGTALNQPVEEIPPQGQLGEISVPFSDAHEGANVDTKVAQRLYYETVHWITEAVRAEDGQVWYSLLDDKFDLVYFIPARHMRLIPEDELAPLSPEVPEAEKTVEVHLEKQLVLAFEGTRLVFAARAATGGQFRDGRWTTPEGQFITNYKRPTRHMAAGDIASSGFDLPGVPWVLYITKSGISFHGTYWHNDYGHPRSHGCINMTPKAAKWLYRWTTPQVETGEQYAYERFGTKVVITE